MYKRINKHEMYCRFCMRICFLFTGNNEGALNCSYSLAMLKESFLLSSLTIWDITKRGKRLKTAYNNAFIMLTLANNSCLVKSLMSDFLVSNLFQ